MIDNILSNIKSNIRSSTDSDSKECNSSSSSIYKKLNIQYANRIEILTKENEILNKENTSLQDLLEINKQLNTNVYSIKDKSLNTRLIKDLKDAYIIIEDKYKKLLNEIKHIGLKYMNDVQNLETGKINNSNKIFEMENTIKLLNNKYKNIQNEYNKIDENLSKEDLKRYRKEILVLETPIKANIDMNSDLVIAKNLLKKFSKVINSLIIDKEKVATDLDRLQMNLEHRETYEEEMLVKSNIKLESIIRNENVTMKEKQFDNSKYSKSIDIKEESTINDMNDTRLFEFELPVKVPTLSKITGNLNNINKLQLDLNYLEKKDDIIIKEVKGTKSNTKILDKNNNNSYTEKLQVKLNNMQEDPEYQVETLVLIIKGLKNNINYYYHKVKQQEDHIKYLNSTNSELNTHVEKYVSIEKKYKGIYREYKQELNKNNI